MFFRNSLKDKKTELPLFEMISIVFFMAYYLLPFVNYKLGFIPGLLAVIIYVFYASVNVDKKLSVYITAIVICSVIIAAWYYILTDTSTISKDVRFYEIKVFLSKLSQVLFAFFPLVILFRIQKAATKKQKKIICYILLALIAYVVILTWCELIINPGATRHWEGFEDMSENNVGTYAFIYAIAILIPALLVFFVSTKKIWCKSLLVLLMLVLFAFLVAAQYTISILISLIGIVVFFFNTSNNKLHKVLVVLLLVMAYVGLPYLLNFIASSVKSDDIATRCTEISDALTGKGLGYNLGGRLGLYGRAILAFIKSPVLGNRTLDFDPHATLLSIPAKTGILGAIPYYYLYITAAKRVFEVLENKKSYKMFLPVYICFICMGFTNPIHSALPIYMVVWLLTPLLIGLLVKNKKRGENTNETVEN